ncbi:secretin N-terminal domain-containing protein [Candidatus Omnitrophota bacterium]
MNFMRTGQSFMVFSLVLSFALLFFIFSFPDFAFATLGEDLISRESWKKISLNLEGASLINVLKVFSQQSGLNFIAAQSVASKPITLYLEDVPIREALDKILDSYQLTYELDEDSNIFVVKRSTKPEVETITKIYPLKYARVTDSPIDSESTISHSGAGIVGVISTMLSPYGRLDEDSRTNSLIITEVPFMFEKIEKALAKLDVSVPQVVIEVEIIDTMKNLVDNLGFNWTSAGGLMTYTLPMHTFPSTSAFSPGGSTPLAMTIGGPAGTSLSLSQLKTHTDTKVLARPKILTLSNQKAEIKIIGDDVIGTTRTEDPEEGTVTVEAERGEIGVELIVTPSVNAQTGEITMVLEPRVTSVEDSGFQDESGNTFRNPQERSAKVTVVGSDNETIILGGLLRKDFSETKTKVPILGDIPFLGALFRHRSKSEDRDREMLVFITPRIVNKREFAEFNQLESRYDTEILSQREQSDYQYRRKEIDRTLTIWDNK